MKTSYLKICRLILGILVINSASLHCAYALDLKSCLEEKRDLRVQRTLESYTFLRDEGLAVLRGVATPKHIKQVKASCSTSVDKRNLFSNAACYALGRHEEKGGNINKAKELYKTACTSNSAYLFACLKFAEIIKDSKLLKLVLEQEEKTCKETGHCTSLYAIEECKNSPIKAIRWLQIKSQVIPSVGGNNIMLERIVIEVDQKINEVNSINSSLKKLASISSKSKEQQDKFAKLEKRKAEIAKYLTELAQIAKPAEDYNYKHREKGK